ncbi:hypothetical protein S245_000183, partial [Arachis hypogaea]
YSILHMVLTMDAYLGVKNKWRPMFYDPHTKIISVHDVRSSRLIYYNISPILLHCSCFLLAITLFRPLLVLRIQVG